MKSKRKLESKTKPKKPIEKVGLNQKEKSKFRSTPEWKQFRVDKISETNGKCECCGRFFKSPKLRIHHKDLDSTKYTHISDPTRFNPSCDCTYARGFIGHQTVRYTCRSGFLLFVLFLFFVL